MSRGVQTVVLVEPIWILDTDADSDPDPEVGGLRFRRVGRRGLQGREVQGSQRSGSDGG